jgi:hypothetical protein
MNDPFENKIRACSELSKTNCKEVPHDPPDTTRRTQAP